MRIGLSLAATEPRYNLLAQNIQALFADGSQGWWFDDDDLTTLFQDSAGTTPVTAVEQFVGLQLDKSKGLVLGPELVTNGDFSAGTTGWTASAVTATVSDGVVTLAGGTGYFYQSFTTVVGKMYKVTGDILQVGTAFTAIRKSDTFNATTNLVNISSSVGAASGVFTATATTTFIILQHNFSVVDGKFDNISVRELPGNHRYAPASGNRPIWSKRVNLLTKTEQFDDAVWVKTNLNTTGTPAWVNVAVAPDGTTTADNIIPNTTSGLHFVDTRTITLVAASYTGSIYAKANGYNFIAIGEVAGTAWAYFDLSNGTVGNTNGSPTASITAVGNGWYRCTVTFTSAGGASRGIFALVDQTNGSLGNWSGNNTSGVLVWGADLRPANQATGTMPLYQRVNTSSDYDTNGFPGYLKADGVDDFLQTNSIDFSAGPTNPPLGPELVIPGNAIALNANGSIAVSGSAITATCTTSGTYGIRLSGILTVQRNYRVAVTVTSNSAPRSVLADMGTTTFAITATTGSKTTTQFVGAGSNFVIYITGATAGESFSVDNISVKEITNANLGADKITLCAGVRKLSDATVQILYELSANVNSNNGAFNAAPGYSGSGSGVGAYWSVVSKGTTGVSATSGATFPAPQTAVQTHIGNISGDSLLLRINGAQVASNTADQGTGNYGNYPAYFFQRNSPVGLRFTGYEYGNIAVGKLLTADQLRALETYMNGLTKAY